MLEFILSILSGLTPAAALPWALVVALGLYAGNTLRTESSAEKELRKQIMQLSKLHNEALSASQESRISDLKDTNLRYDKTLREVLSVLNKFKREDK